MSTRVTFWVLVLVLISNVASAQVAHILPVSVPGIAHDVYLPSAAYPAGGATTFGAEPLPNSGILSPVNADGGMTINQTNGMVLSCDGTTITYDYNPLYSPFVGAPPLPAAAPAPVLLGLMPIQGMAWDTTTNILWLTDGVSLGGFTPTPPFLPVTPLVWLLPTLPGTNRLVGLDIETATGTLWGCGVNGNIYNFTTGGAPVGAQPVATIALAPLSAGLGGLCVNRTNGPGAVGAPFCSTQTPGYHICATDGQYIYDGLTVTNPPILASASSTGPARGLAMSSDFQTMPGAGPSTTTGSIPIIGMNKATHNGLGGINAFRLIDGPPGTAALLMYDFCPIPGGLFIPASGETLWLNPFSTTFSTGSFATDPAGDITLTFSFAGGLAGIQFSMQWAVKDALAPLGYCLSDGICWTIGDQ